ncbi:MAG: Asp23/Gls24 family envelope stress response protein [Dehalococcoidia bacterium]
MTSPREPIAGTVRVSPAVVRSIAALAALESPGVVAVGKRRVPPRGKPLPGGYHDGVRAKIEGDAVTVDIDLTVDGGANLFEVGRRVQDVVSKAIAHSLGFRIQAVNVRIQNVA